MPSSRWLHRPPGQRGTYHKEGPVFAKALRRAGADATSRGHIYSWHGWVRPPYDLTLAVNRPAFKYGLYSGISIAKESWQDPPRRLDRADVGTVIVSVTIHYLSFLSPPSGSCGCRLCHIQVGKVLGLALTVN